MDKILIKDLEVYGYHGVYAEENKLGQRFLISADIVTDYAKAAREDDIHGTINYGELCHELEKVFLEQKFNLIEAAATALAEYILLTYKGLAKKVTVTLKKPWAPIGKPIDYAGVQVTKSWHQVFIAFGSNLGDPQAQINEGKSLLLQHPLIEMVKESQVIETEPWGYTDQNNFLNGVWEISTLLEPRELMDILLDIELQLKRKREIKWGPRTLDLDIIFYDQLISTDDHIILPHPRMHQRLFVLEPLAEIAPYALHPLLRKRVVDLVEDLKEDK